MGSMDSGYSEVLESGMKSLKPCLGYYLESSGFGAALAMGAAGLLVDSAI